VSYELQRCGDGKLRPVKGSADANLKVQMCVFHTVEKKIVLLSRIKK
jgi:hypothetical protein